MDIYYLHAADRSTPFKETLKAMDDLYKEGKFKTFALSNFTAAEVSLFSLSFFFFLKIIIVFVFWDSFLNGGRKRNREASAIGNRKLTFHPDPLALNQRSPKSA